VLVGSVEGGSECRARGSQIGRPEGLEILTGHFIASV
jgi:hypothetical protein